MTRAHVKRLRALAARFLLDVPPAGRDLLRVLNEHERMEKALERIETMERGLDRAAFGVGDVVRGIARIAREALAPRRRKS